MKTGTFYKKKERREFHKKILSLLLVNCVAFVCLQRMNYSTNTYQYICLFYNSLLFNTKIFSLVHTINRYC